MVDPTRSNGLSLRNTCIKLRRTWWLNKCWSSHSELPYAPPSKVNLSIVSFPVAPPKKMQFNKKLDTIVDPHKKHTIEDHGHSWIFFWFAELPPLEKPFDFYSKKNEAK